MDQDEHIIALEENLLEYYIDHNDGTLKFIHGNAPIHCSYPIKQFLEDNVIKPMNFPSYSPDLNLIENRCKIHS